MRKSSRGNPWHDSKGRFCSGPQSGGVIKSEKTPEEYEARTRERFGNTKIGYDIKGKPNTFTTVSEVIAAQRAKGLEKPRQYKERKPPTGNNGRFAPTEQKCPKCGATLANGRCLKCGYPDIRKMENQQVAPQVRTLRKMGFTKVDDEDFRNQFGNSTVYIKDRKHTRTLVAVDNETGLVYCSWTNSKSGELVEARFDSVEEWENQGEYHNTDKPQRNWWVNRCKSIRENLKLSEIRLEECKVDEKGNRWYGATDSYGNRGWLFYDFEEDSGNCYFAILDGGDKVKEVSVCNSGKNSHWVDDVVLTEGVMFNDTANLSHIPTEDWQETFELASQKAKFGE